MPKKKQSKKRKRKSKPKVEYRYTLVQRSGPSGAMETALLKQRWNADTQTWEACE